MIWPIALIAVGVAVTLFAISLLARPTRWSRVDGEITGLSSSAPSWAPLRGASFRYVAADGTEHTVWTPDGTAVGPAVGSTMTVRHDPSDPARARLVPSTAQVLPLIIVGDVITLVGILVLVL